MSAQFIQEAILKGVDLRTDLLKWKLISVGAIGSFGIGSTQTSSNAPWVLLLIPLICAYVDLIYRNSCLRRNALRSYAISKQADPVYADLAELLSYEQQQYARRTRGFSFESGALVWSSLILCIAVALYPLITHADAALRSSLIVAGAVGFVLAVTVETIYSRLDTQYIG